MKQSMDDKAKQLLVDYLLETVDLGDLPNGLDILIISKAESFNTTKWFMDTSLDDGKYYEIVYDEERHEWRITEYEQKTYRVIPANF